jgi:hypothetical protein
MNMFKPSKATTVKEYFQSMEPERRETMKFLDAFIQKAVPTLKQHFAANMIGYGSFPYKNSKKEIAQWHTVGLASQKNYISIYVCSVLDGTYLAEMYKKDLGKVTVGKSCISFKKVEDVNLDALKKVLKAAEKNPGLEGLRSR